MQDIKPNNGFYKSCALKYSRKRNNKISAILKRKILQKFINKYSIMYIKMLKECYN